MRTCVRFSLVLNLIALSAFTNAAPPKGKAPASAPKVDADVLPPGHFVGTIASAPNSERMFTLKVTYPEVRRKPGARMPNLSHAHAQYVHNQYRQMMNLQQQTERMEHYRVHNIMQMQQMHAQMQMNEQRTLARLQQQKLQQELRLLQQEIRAIQNTYQVVSVTRNIDFQADANVKVRLKDLPEQFDEKGNIKRYTREELSALKGKDKELMGYESSVEALQPGQVVLVSLRSHKKSSSNALATPISKKDKSEDTEADSSTEHKMQATMIVILKDGDALQNSTAPAKKKKK